MNLRTRALGTTDMAITTVGVGTWAMAGPGWAASWGPQDDNESIGAIHHAVGEGINWIDTAAVYGLGHAEEVVGRALRGLSDRDRPLVFTKCGMVWEVANPSGPIRRILAPASIRDECEASLRRLGLERIDLYQIHWPDQIGTPIEDSWAEMSRLADEGKVRAIGVSNFDLELLDRCEKLRHVDSLQPPLSLIVRTAGQDVIPWCAAHRTAVIVYSPLQSGLLADHFSPQRLATLPDEDWRRRSPLFQEPELSRSLALRDALRPIARRHGTSVAAVAVAWAIGWPGVAGAIVGARSPTQVDGWIGAARLQLATAEVQEIADAIRRTGAGTGPVRPTG